MFISTAMAKYVISAGSALAPDLHEKYPFRRALSYLFILSALCSRLHLDFVRLPAAIVDAPTALSPIHSSHTHAPATGRPWIGHCLHLNNTRCSSAKWANKESIFFFYSFLVCITVVGAAVGPAVYCLCRGENASEKRSISLSSLFNVLLPSLRKSNEQKNVNASSGPERRKRYIKINRIAFEGNFPFIRLSEERRLGSIVQ